MNDEKRRAIETCFGNLLELNGSEFARTEEFPLRQQRKVYLDELLTTCLNNDQKLLVAEVLS